MRYLEYIGGLENSFDTNKQVSYYVFERKKQSYVQTARVDKKESVTETIKKLQAVATAYLKHRYFTVNDNNYWDKFLSETSYYELWMDNSQILPLRRTGKCNQHISHVNNNHCTTQ